MSTITTKPYLVRAIFEWCTDSGLTPYIIVNVGKHMRVPTEFAKEGRIVLNISHSATRNLTISNDMITFSARFSGRSQDIEVPMDAVASIYARENAQGLSFATEEDGELGDEPASAVSQEMEGVPDDDPPAPPRPKPQLRIVK